MKKKKRRAGIKSAFTPGLLKNDAKGDQGTMEKLFKVYEKALHDCGFKSFSINNSTSSPRGPAPWKISMPASANFEGQMILNEKKDLVKLTERSINWVHDTLISGKKQVFKDSIQANPDVRIVITSTKKIEEETELYNTVLKTETKGNYNLPVKWDEKNNPKLVSENSHVANVRHIKSYTQYTNGNKVNATIAFGENFSLGSEVPKPFCELILIIDPVDLKKAITHCLNENCIDHFARNVFYTSLKIKQKLEEVLNNMGDTGNNVIFILT